MGQECFKNNGVGDFFVSIEFFPQVVILIPFVVAKFFCVLNLMIILLNFFMKRFFLISCSF